MKKFSFALALLLAFMMAMTACVGPNDHDTGGNTGGGQSGGLKKSFYRLKCPLQPNLLSKSTISAKNPTIT